LYLEHVTKEKEENQAGEEGGTPSTRTTGSNGNRDVLGKKDQNKERGKKRQEKTVSGVKRQKEEDGARYKKK